MPEREDEESDAEASEEEEDEEGSGCLGYRHGGKQDKGEEEEEGRRNGRSAVVDPNERALEEAARVKGEIGDSAGTGTDLDTTNLAELEVVGDTDCGTGGEDPSLEGVEVVEEVAEAVAGAYTGVADNPFSIGF